MGENDLEGYLSELFSDIVPDQEPEVDAKAEAEAETEGKEQPSLEDAVIFGLLGAESVSAPVAAERIVEPPLTVFGPEEIEDEREIPQVSVSIGDAAPGKRRVNILRLLLCGVIILGGAPLVIWLVSLLRQEPLNRAGLSLCLAFYTLAVAVTLVQWLFNSSLTKTIQETEDERDKAARSCASLAGQVSELAANNVSLQKRVLQLQASAQVVRDVASTLEQDELVCKTVDLICDRFDLYHVALFLVDESGEWAVLRAGTGEAGEQMLAQGHRLEISDCSLIGSCVVGAQARIALDVAAVQARSVVTPGEEDVSLVDTIEANSLLPKTRSEMALPLLVGDRVIGVLDIHSTIRGAFSAEDIPVFQALADQVAIAVDNARTFAETQARLRELEQSLAREQQVRLAPARSIPLYERTQPGVRPFDDTLLSDVERAMAQRKVLVQSNAGDGAGETSLVAPIALRGEIIGALGLQETEGGRQWTGDEVALIEAVVDQMALAIENTRLIEDTRRRAEREQALSDMTARFSRSLNVDGLLRTAVRELGRLLRIEGVSVHVGPPEDTPSLPGEFKEGI